jgi:hypothetical protein
VAVFIKDKSNSEKYTNRIQDSSMQFKNGRLLNEQSIINYVENIQDESFKIIAIKFLKAVKKLIRTMG